MRELSTIGNNLTANSPYFSGGLYYNNGSRQSLIFMLELNDFYLKGLSVEDIKVLGLLDVDNLINLSYILIVLLSLVILLILFFFRSKFK